MLVLPALKPGDRLSVSVNGRPPMLVLVHEIGADGVPITRTWSIGNWGLAHRFPIELEGLELLEVMPAQPPAPEVLPPVESLRALLKSHYLKLADQPHPTARRAALGESLADYATWCLANGGTACKARVVGLIHSALRAPENISV